MYESEKNFLERIADAIPGVRGYREKESRRDTDKRLREHVAAEIDRLRRSLEGFKRDQLAKGRLELLDDADRIVRQLQKVGDQVRFATYGYAGFFDQVKVQERELDRIYAFDGELLARVRSLDGEVAALSGAEDPAAALATLAASVEGLAEQVERRKQIFSTPE